MLHLAKWSSVKTAWFSQHNTKQITLLPATPSFPFPILMAQPMAAVFAPLVLAVRLTVYSAVLQAGQALLSLPVAHAG